MNDFGAGDIKYTSNVGLKIYNTQTFQGAVKAAQINGKNFRIINKSYSTEFRYRSVNDLPQGNRRIPMGGFLRYSDVIKNEAFDNNCLAAIRDINKDFWNHLIELCKAGRLEPIKPLFKWPQSFVFRENWNALPVGDLLWFYDFNNFYPSIAVRLGYLTKETVDKYTYNVEDTVNLKRGRNIALSRIRSVIKVEYYIDGKLSHTISSDNSYVENAYANIIMFGRNIINKVCFKYSHRVIGRDVDNLILPFEKSTYIPGRYLTEQGLDYKKYLCQKVSPNQFMILWDKRVKTVRNFLSVSDNGQ
jgi:hypothetical protein